jgi:hypothetical protein
MVSKLELAWHFWGCFYFDVPAQGLKSVSVWLDDCHCDMAGLAAIDIRHGPGLADVNAADHPARVTVSQLAICIHFHFRSSCS